MDSLSAALRATHAECVALVGERAFAALHGWVLSQLEAAAAADDDGGGDGDGGGTGAAPTAAPAAGGKGFAEQVLALVPSGALGAVSLAYRLLYLEDAIAGCRGELAALSKRGDAAGTGGGGPLQTARSSRGGTFSSRN